MNSNDIEIAIMSNLSNWKEIDNVKGYYQYVDNRQLSLYCEKYNADGITPYNVFANLLNEPVEYISSKNSILYRFYRSRSIK